MASTLPTCDVVVSSPGAVDVEVSEEQAAGEQKVVMLRSCEWAAGGRWLT